MGGSSCIPKAFWFIKSSKEYFESQIYAARFDLKKTLEIDLEKGDLPNFPLKIG